MSDVLVERRDRVGIITLDDPDHRNALNLGLCAELVDAVKDQIPIWKRQVFTDGTDEWVACP